MTYILTALHAEALPMIRRFDLQPMTRTPFPIYRNQDIALIVSGVGNRNAAAATAHLLTLLHPAKGARLLNIGICGAQKKEIQIGTLFQIAKIVDPASESVYHLKNSVQFAPGGRVASFERPQSELTSKYQLVDMESVGVWMAGRRFLSAGSIYLFKVVSDHLSTDIPERGFVEGLIEQHLPTLEMVIATGVA